MGGCRKADVGSRMSEGGSRRSEVGCWMSEVGSRTSEVGGQSSEDRGQRSEDRGRMSDVGGRGTEDRGQKSEDRGRRSEGRGQRGPIFGVRSLGSALDGTTRRPALCSLLGYWVWLVLWLAFAGVTRQRGASRDSRPKAKSRFRIQRLSEIHRVSAQGLRRRKRRKIGAWVGAGERVSQST
ncbi:hypothetical protein GALL_300320 [mine drainage metagenome]|uniref:Uncharacterized protein n=1 Tax=mine drainage metagenome TaxID=410659 RepID=A0A1J5R7R6_9ZZZZ